MFYQINILCFQPFKRLKFTSQKNLLRTKLAHFESADLYNFIDRWQFRILGKRFSFQKRAEE